MRPPAADEMSVTIAIGDQARLTAEVFRALDNLARLLEEEQQPVARPEAPCDRVYTTTCRVYSCCIGVETGP